MGYRDQEHEEMKESVYLGAGMLATTLSQIDKERNKRIMGCRKAIHRDFIVPPRLYEITGVSISVATMCDLVLKFALVPLISMMNRSITRIEDSDDIASLGIIKVSESELEAFYDSWAAIREAAYANIDSFYDQWQTFISRLGLDRSDKIPQDRGWAPVEEETVDKAKKAEFAQKDRQKKEQQEDDEKNGGWPSFTKLRGLVGKDDYGRPKVPRLDD